MSESVFTHILTIAEPKHPDLAQAINAVGPVELTADEKTPVAEKLCRSIAGQQLSVKAAQTIWSRVEASANAQDLITHFHQSPPDQLRQCGLSAAKTRAIKEIAQKVQDNSLDCEKLKTLSANQRAEILLTLWGVGQWTVDMTNIFYYGEPDIWPDNDVTAKNTLLRLTNEKVTASEVAAHFAPYRSYLALFMYQIADAQPD